jgi:2-methylcitrate dehydratase PrpD
MRMRHRDNSIGRRLFLAGGAAMFTGISTVGWPQPAARTESRKLSARIADFAVGFDLAKAPPLAVGRARTAFVDTVGVTLAGSTEKVAAIVRDMVKAEGAAPQASVIGSPLRTSPQLAALANGVASHALDFDFTYTQGQLMAPVIPALLPLAEQTGATPAETLSAFMVGFEVCSRLSRANRPTTASVSGTAPAQSARSARRSRARG